MQITRHRAPLRPEHPGSGSFDGETVTRRRMFTGGALAVGGIATAAVGLPALGFALGPVFSQTEPHRWQDVGPEADFGATAYTVKIVDLVADIGDSGKTTVYVRRYNRTIDGVRGSDLPYVAVSNRCTHVGCPVRYAQA